MKFKGFKTEVDKNGVVYLRKGNYSIEVPSNVKDATRIHHRGMGSFVRPNLREARDYINNLFTISVDKLTLIPYQEVTPDFFQRNSNRSFFIFEGKSLLAEFVLDDADPGYMTRTLVGGTNRDVYKILRFIRSHIGDD